MIRKALIETASEPLLAASQKTSQSLSLNAKTLPMVTRVIREYLVRHWMRIVLSFVLLGIVSACTAMIPFIMKELLDNAFRGGPPSENTWLTKAIGGLLSPDPRYNQLYFITLATAVVFTVKGSAAYGAETMMAYVGHRSIADIQETMFARLMRADLGYFHNTPTGTLISAFTNDATKMRTLFSDTVTGIGRDIVTVVALIIAMFWIDWILSSVAFFVFPLAAIPINQIGRRMRRFSANTQIEMAQFTTLQEESFQGVRHVKAYGMEDYESGRTRSVVERIFRLNYKAAKVRAIAEPLLEVIAGCAVAGVLLYGGYQVIAGARTPGDFGGFIAALLLAYEPVRKLARLNANLQEGLAAAERVFATLDIEPRIRDRPGAEPLVLSSGAIRFNNVVFSYHHRAPALGAPGQGVSLEIPAGKVAALVGPSGAGKTTVLNLIPRFYDVDGGAVLVDGQDIRDVTLASLRAHIGLVSQETSLFDDTVLANIAYGRQGATGDEIIAAAKMAAAHDFIMELPQQYDTRVGGTGAKVSGGQRQRISIARAILKDAPILLLDEATSALDNESERQVQEALESLRQGRTTIVIAHRLSTIADADIIYVLEDGQITEQGTNSDLLAAGGAYARLHAGQMGNDGARQT
ncbi:MAG: ABC transporter ATP-binding protein [Rhodospirillaceae bacterium]|nr:ABC transporter ATP-binding protein [Rhodospirillaceae bacterium]